MLYSKYRRFLSARPLSVQTGLSLIILLTVLLCTDALAVRAAEEYRTAQQEFPLLQNIPAASEEPVYGETDRSAACAGNGTVFSEYSAEYNPGASDFTAGNCLTSSDFSAENGRTVSDLSAENGRTASDLSAENIPDALAYSAQPGPGAQADPVQIEPDAYEVPSWNGPAAADAQAEIGPAAADQSAETHPAVSVDPAETHPAASGDPAGNHPAASGDPAEESPMASGGPAGTEPATAAESAWPDLSLPKEMAESTMARTETALGLFSSSDNPDTDGLLLTAPVGSSGTEEAVPTKAEAAGPENPGDDPAGKEDPDDPNAGPAPMPDFRVKKEAETGHATPGDTVRYRISIENTGNVVLHSVVSTEKFLGAGVQAAFEAQENILLNAGRTQALISEIAPGETAVLYARVVIPQDAQAQELINMVEVTTQETGTRTVQSESRIPLVTPSAAPVQNKESPQQTVLTESGTARTYSPVSAQNTANPQAVPVYSDNTALRTVPQTMDPSPLLLLISIGVLSFVTVLTCLVCMHSGRRQSNISGRL